MYRYMRVYIITPGFGLNSLKYSINRRWPAEIMTTCIHMIYVYIKNHIYIYYMCSSINEYVCVSVCVCMCVWACGFGSGMTHG